MSFMNVNGSTGSSTNFWNFSNREKDGYKTMIVGHVVELQLVPKTKFGKREIDRFDDGNPKRNLRVIIQQDDGTEIAWDFAPGGRDNRARGGEDKRSAAMRALADALVAIKPDAKDIEDCLGMRIKVSTQEPPEGWSYSKNNPRPWTVLLDMRSMVEHRGCVVKPDWEREGGEYDAPEPQPAQVGGAPSSEFQAAQQRAQEAVMRNTVPTEVYEQSGAASVYDEDIPF